MAASCSSCGRRMKLAKITDKLYRMVCPDDGTSWGVKSSV